LPDYKRNDEDKDEKEPEKEGEAVTSLFNFVRPGTGCVGSRKPFTD
jgi:hypothetical protein